MRILPSGWRSTTIVMRSEVASISMTFSGSSSRIIVPSLLTLKPCSLNEFSHPRIVGLQLAIHQLAIMARDDSETKSYIGRRLGFS